MEVYMNDNGTAVKKINDYPKHEQEQFITFNGNKNKIESYL